MPSRVGIYKHFARVEIPRFDFCGIVSLDQICQLSPEMEFTGDIVHKLT
jgi:hypothetical protein